MLKFDVFARAGMHGVDAEIQKTWFWMDTLEATSPEAASIAVFDRVKADYPQEWAAWTRADFKAYRNPGVPIGEPGYGAALRALEASMAGSPPETAGETP